MKKGGNKINIVTLGCSKNLVDSEHLAAQIAASGMEVVYDSSSTDARTIVINTCGFIGDAKEESVNMILDFARAKTAGKIDRLYVMGCLSERYRDDLIKEIPEADSFFGVNDLKEILAAVSASYRSESETERLLSTPHYYAYLKISEGCNWGCSYCAIPLIRGRHVSVPLETLEQEARKLASKGVKELMVIGQDTTFYGLDLYGERKLGQLLERLCRIDGLEWIRLHYAYPASFPEDVIEVMAREPKICKYLDIPFQHISDNMLGAMHRGVSKKQTLDLIERLRTKIPGIALRTTLLVGFPGESEEDFEELIRFIEEIKFERLGVFTYSEEEGTGAAKKYPDGIPPQVKQQRADRIMEIQSRISLEKNMEREGKTERVIIDRREEPFLIGRSQYDSPEVDTEILISGGDHLKAGDFCTVNITSSEEYDLYGELAVD